MAAADLLSFEIAAVDALSAGTVAPAFGVLSRRPNVGEGIGLPQGDEPEENQNQAAKA
jgi:hypothetical protein